jgi:hypothetical protein
MINDGRPGGNVDSILAFLRATARWTLPVRGRRGERVETGTKRWTRRACVGPGTKRRTHWARKDDGGRIEPGTTRRTHPAKDHEADGRLASYDEADAPDWGRRGCVGPDTTGRTRGRARQGTMRRTRRAGYEEADAVRPGTKRRTCRAGSKRRTRGAKDEEADMRPQLLRR